jgi:hypothetical protein
VALRPVLIRSDQIWWGTGKYCRGGGWYIGSGDVHNHVTLLSRLDSEFEMNLEQFSN